MTQLQERILKFLTSEQSELIRLGMELAMSQLSVKEIAQLKDNDRKTRIGGSAEKTMRVVYIKDDIAIGCDIYGVHIIPTSKIGKNVFKNGLFEVIKFDQQNQ